ncbi:MAG TPA: HAD-IC family P-type ATPase, partial [Alphaproteobacteria bacterium]|nr:HAD-IC family P-type ATPase [Alphaproteobacteria bacterium]
LFVLSNPLRPGTRDIINFFQNKGVRIRVISGDNPQTVQAVAGLAGIKHADMIITGPEMENWDDEEYEERVPAYHLYARIRPEQKEKIVTLLKRNGFTAMVGDGANDALAIKKADLGIAMFDGAGATRQIAQVVLMNNSFSALPTGVDLAETIITNIELVASVFFNSVIIGLIMFFALAVLGYTYPLSPRNTTIINYFIIWLPMVYWAVFPAREKGSHADQSFLRSVVPFSLLNGTLTALAAVIVFMLGPQSLRNAGSNVFVIFTIIALGYWFFVLTPLAYGLTVGRLQRRVLYFLAGLGVVFLLLVLLQPSWSVFFDLQRPAFAPLMLTLCAAFLFGWLQYRITKRWFGKRK